MAGNEHVKGHEPNTLGKAVRAWERWCVWLKTETPLADPYNQLPATWAGFLKSVAENGPTAAARVYGSLSFLEEQGQLGLPLEASVVSGYKHSAWGTSRCPKRRWRCTATEPS